MLGSATVTLAQPQDPGRPYWSDNWRGWHFYEEPEVPPPEPPASAPRQAATASSAATAPRRSPAKPRRSSSSSACRGPRGAPTPSLSSRPTEVNGTPLHGAGAQVVSRASTLPDVAQRIAWASPELDPTLQGAGRNAKRWRCSTSFRRPSAAGPSVPWAATMSCSSSSAATAPTVMPSRRRSRPSRPGTASRWSRSASTVARSPASRTPGGTTGSPPRCG